MGNFLRFLEDQRPGIRSWAAECKKIREFQDRDAFTNDRGRHPFHRHMNGLHDLHHHTGIDPRTRRHIVPVQEVWGLRPVWPL